MALATRTDIHLDFVRPHLKESQLVVVDVSDLEGGLTYEFDGEGVWPAITYQGVPLDLFTDVNSVWYRQLNVTKMRPLNINPPEQQEYAISSMQHQHEAVVLLINPSAFWVSDRQSIRTAELKPYQLRLASVVGGGNWRVPPTLFAADGAKVRAFIRQHGQCIVKPLSWRMPPGYDQYTAISSPDLDFRGLIINPHIFQPVIEPDFEVRVAVAGTQVCANIVTDKDPGIAQAKGVRDYRHAFGKGTFHVERFKLKTGLRMACIELVRRLGVQCGFIDLIFDKAGICWFLEVNPNGEFGFMHAADIEIIGRAIAQLLESGQSPWR